VGRLQDTIDLCQSSLQKNRYHLPTVRALVVAQYELGRVSDAKTTFGLIRTLQPDLTMQKYLASGGESPVRQRCARVLKALGLPAQ
jgi:hypothetical protein